MNNQRILLTILPYWDPMIPPMGITSLKRFLENHNYVVKTIDYIVKPFSLLFYKEYFQVLRTIVPIEKQGNFNNIGHDVLQNHMMAWINSKSESDELLTGLVNQLIFKHYYCSSDKSQILELNNLVKNFYETLAKEFTQDLEEFCPDVVGATAYKCTLPASLYVMQMVKKYNPEIITVLGGGTFNESHAPGSPSFEALLNYSQDYLDNVLLGQGEILFLSYLRSQLPEKKRVYTNKDIKEEILDLDDMEIPDFSDLDLSSYPYLAATASVSCYYSCSFCVAKKVSGAYRKKCPSKLVSEMVEMHRKYSNQLFFMTDSLINPVLTDLSNEFIKSETSLYYDAYFKVDQESADSKNTLLWRKGGLYRVRIGTESGSQRILDEMNKGITVDQIRQTIKSLAYAGIKTTTYWVMGHPGETEEDFQMTLDLIEELKDDIFQAECNYFLYHYSNQAKEDLWSSHRKPLYDEKYDKLLVFKYWDLKLEPRREEIFKRVHRFTNHCEKLGIPNPYSYEGHRVADKRWQKLHVNAVPPIMDFLEKGNLIQENKDIIVEHLLENERTSTEFIF